MIKEKSVKAYATTRIDVEDIMLSEISQTQKDKHYIISLTGDT